MKRVIPHGSSRALGRRVVVDIFQLLVDPLESHGLLSHFRSAATRSGHSHKARYNSEMRPPMSVTESGKYKDLIQCSRCPGAGHRPAGGHTGPQPRVRGGGGGCGWGGGSGWSGGLIRAAAVPGVLQARSGSAPWQHVSPLPCSSLPPLSTRAELCPDTAEPQHSS